MKCWWSRRRLRAQLTAYLDGDLTAPEAEAVARSAAADPVLSRELRRLTAVRRAVTALPAVTPPPGFRSALEVDLDLAQRPVLESLSDLLDGQLDATHAAALRAELDADPALADLAARVQQAVAAARALPRVPVPPGFRAAVMARVEELDPTPVRAPFALPRFVWAGATVLAMVFGFTAVSSREGPLTVRDAVITAAAEEVTIAAATVAAPAPPAAVLAEAEPPAPAVRRPARPAPRHEPGRPRAVAARPRVERPARLTRPAPERQPVSEPAARPRPPRPPVTTSPPARPVPKVQPAAPAPMPLTAPTAEVVLATAPEPTTVSPVEIPDPVVLNQLDSPPIRLTFASSPVETGAARMAP